MKTKMILIALLVGGFLVYGCEPELKGMCVKNSECIEGYLCNLANDCVEVEQKEMEILVDKLDDAVVGKHYAFELSVRGGLAPYTWSISAGPAWLRVERDEKSGVWILTGEPGAFQNDTLVVKLTVKDNSIGEGQGEGQIVGKDLSIRSLYCTQQEQIKACSGHGECNAEGKCVCNDAHIGNQCGQCNSEKGYKLNENQECIRYQYQCGGNDCGADVEVRECKDESNESCEEWKTDKDCGLKMFCSDTGNNFICMDCGAYECSEGKCQGCNIGDPCCEESGTPLPTDKVCAEWTEYRCTELLCGGEGQERDWVQYCSGGSGGCDGIEKPGQWNTISGLVCGDNQACISENGSYPKCMTCEHGCAEEACWPECDPSSNGCCTPEGMLIDDCWYDPVANLAWQDPPLGDGIKWMDAKKACNDLVVEGVSDWRLPTISELRSLIRACSATQLPPLGDPNCGVRDDAEKTCLSEDCRDNSCYGCDRGQGPGTEGCYWDPNLQGSCGQYWSSSEVKESSIALAWYIYFPSGNVYYYSQGSIGHRTRCVRSGP